jgi:hypothetical protein
VLSARLEGWAARIDSWPMVRDGAKAPPHHEDEAEAGNRPHPESLTEKGVSDPSWRDSIGFAKIRRRS